MIPNSEIIAHKYQLELLIKSYNNKFPHSWIFNGKKGIGKHTTALNFIKHIYKNQLNFEQNVFHINSDEKLALLDDIRNMINQIHLTNSNIGQKCFIIIDNANLLNFNSYNALLKTIEEPPENTVVIIICHDLKNIPKTVKSRCIILNFRQLSLKELHDYCELKNIKLDNVDLEEYSYLIDGSIEMLSLLTNEKGSIIILALEKILKSKNLSYDEFEKFYELLSKDYDKYFKLIISCIFENQKRKYIQNQKNVLVVKRILKFFKDIQILSHQNINIDNKKELHYLLSECISTN